ncbi:MAG: Gfo/Idh/MocA family oxidoreductase [Bacteroidota bacterium]
MIKVAVVGYGYWGPNLVRNFSNTEGCEVAYVFDLSASQLERVRKAYPSIHTTDDYSKILKDASVDAVVIATPVFSHFGLAKDALEHGKHVLLEKPMTASVAEAQELVELALAKEKVLMVDHTYLYNPAVEKIKEIVDAGTLGHIKYIDSTRINLGLFQTDVNVLWDLAPHDISICNYLMNDQPKAIQAIGVSHTDSDLENIAYLTLFYSDNRIAHFNCSWVSPVKIRQMLIGGDQKMIVYNDLETTEKIRVYDKGYSVLPKDERNRLLVDYRVGDVLIPKVKQKEALAGMAEDFCKAIREGGRPLSDFHSGLQVVSILEAAGLSMKSNNSIIELNTFDYA